MILKKILNKSKKQSFSLIELSIVICALSVITIVIVNGSMYAVNTAKQKANQNKLLNIKIALSNYFNEHKRLPKPADINIAKNNTLFGTEPTEMPNMYKMINGTIYTKIQNKNITSTNIGIYLFYGIVPFKELGLAEKDVIDAYDNFIEYYVPEFMTLNIDEKPIKYSSDVPLKKIGYGIRYKEQLNDEEYNYSIYPCPSIAEQKPDAICDANEDNLPIGIIFEGILNDEKITFTQPPYGIRIKNVKTGDFLLNNGEIAYLLITHGENGSQTCSIKNNKEKNQTLKITNVFLSTGVNKDKQYEAQNCINAEENSTFNIVARDNFLNGKNQEFIFYQGNKNTFFDDLVEYDTLINLINKSNIS